MTFDEYDKKYESFKEFPLPQINYGFTKEDVEILKSNPNKYMDFMIYILSLPAYEDPDTPHNFINYDALPQKLLVKEINNIMKNALVLED